MDKETYDKVIDIQKRLDILKEVSNAFKSTYEVRIQYGQKVTVKLDTNDQKAFFDAAQNQIAFLEANIKDL